MNQKLRILILEDTPTDAELAERELRKGSIAFTSMRVETRDAFIGALEKFRPDIVLSDYKLPDFNGMDALKIVQRDHSEVPVIMVTGALTDIEAVELIQAGAKDYVLKNSLARLVPAVKRTLAADQVARAHKAAEMALREGEARIRTVLNMALDAFISMNSAGLVTEWNAEAEKLFGYSRDDVLGKDLAKLIIPMAYRDEHARGLAHFMETGEGSFVGGRIEVTATRSDGREFPAELSITAIRQSKDTFFSAFVRDITERKQIESRISFLAYHDKLTELPNRELFYDRLSHSISHARRKHHRLALLFLDLDGFKAVNDIYGHAAGDLVLKKVARRLQACIRTMDTVARLGGDEFTIILSDLKKTAAVIDVAEKIIHKLCKPILLTGSRKCSIGVSIGIAMYPEDGYELDKLMSAADSAMYESKAVGKNTYTFFKEKKNEQSEQAWIVFEPVHFLGVPEIDRQHQKLINMINQLNEAVKNNSPTEVSIHLFDEVISFARSHFETEERLMDKYGYIEDEEHKQAHQRLMGEANYLWRQFTQGGELLVLQYIKDWLLPHILDMDKPLANFLIQRGVNKSEKCEC